MNRPERELTAFDSLRAALGVLLALAVASFIGPTPAAAQDGPGDEALSFAPGPHASDGLRVQNPGIEPARFLVVSFPEVQGNTGDGSCADCQAAAAACSPLLDSRESWTAPVPAGASSTVFALSDVGANAAGPGWPGWLEENGFERDTAPATALCEHLAAAPDPGERCERYRLLHRAFTGTDAAALGPSLEAVRGEAVAATGAVLSQTELNGEAWDLVGAHTWAEVGPASTDGAETHVSIATGVHLAPQDGRRSTVVLQNAGVACTTATLSLFPTGLEGPDDTVATVSVPPGSAARVPAGQVWALPKTGAVRIEADGPVAAGVVTVGYDTASAHGAQPLTEPGVVWGLPLVYNEWRPGPVGALQDGLVPDWDGDVSVWPRGQAASRAVLADGLPNTFDGWVSPISFFTTADERWSLRIRSQAQGRPDRSVSLAFEPHRQVVFEVGLGLDQTGGEGWADVSASEGASQAAVEYVREAVESPRMVETWSARGWPTGPDVPVARTVAFPDLGGPAVGPGVAASDPMTTGLEARIAVQNLGETEAVVAFDALGRCGPGGSITRTLAPRQGLTVPAIEIPGVLNGANAALMRVADGEVAAVFEMSRRERFEEGGPLPQDLTAGYRGLGLSVGVPPPVVPEATLRAVPTAVVVEDPLNPEPVLISLDFEADGPRCLGYEAAADVDWIRLHPRAGSLPGRLTLTFESAGLPPGPHQGTVTVKPTGPHVVNAPLLVPVTLTVPPGAIYLPALKNDVPATEPST